jgi:hypothetical protein
MYSDELWMQWVTVQKNSARLLARKDFDGALGLVSGFLGEQSDPGLLGEVLLLKSDIEERRGNLTAAKQDLLKAHALSSPATYHRYVVELSLAGLSTSTGILEEAKGWYVKALETVIADPLTSGIAAVIGLLRHVEWRKLPPHERDLCEKAILQSWSLFSLPGSPDFENLDATFEAIQKAYSQPLANP